MEITEYLNNLELPSYKFVKVGGQIQQRCVQYLIADDLTSVEHEITNLEQWLDNLKPFPTINYWKRRSMFWIDEVRQIPERQELLNASNDMP